ncbi:CUB and sushi domain-containing protein 1-like [Haliotis rubra]|uniref:CUB and sushi domain-containing protein 1-like n=1 Tax=Haliotis rubra TaxID=36100 RepID=UPI001EE56F7D|nr:CUB and sushi domain-containing protein 1-like [Haliotis rubra]
MKFTLQLSETCIVLLFPMLHIMCQECGENRTGTYGTVTSPLYPDKYQNDQNCTYIIDAGTTLIRLVFVDFQVEKNFDAVEVYDAYGSLLAFLGGGKSGYVMQPSNYYRLQFTSDSSFTKRGFNATWTIAAAFLKQNITNRVYGECGYDQTFVRMSSSGLTLGHLETLSSTIFLDCMHICRIDVFCAAIGFVGETCSLFHNIEGDDGPASIFKRM